MTCMSTVSYQINLNGTLLTPFEGKKGLRQGDPISPYLFVLCMEYLSRMIHTLKDDARFKFHPKCAKLNITHLVFADDLLFFSNGTPEAVYTLLDLFEQFSSSSGLTANKQKSEIYFSGVNLARRSEILERAGLQEGTLPFRYLGIPLNAKRLSIVQYQPLLEKMVSKVHHWTAKLLSYGGRLQLIQSVLFSIQFYWSHIFPFPKKVMKAVEAICRKFLWAGDIESKKSSVAWEDVCRPRGEGGLNLIHLSSWNRACLLKLLWAIHKKSGRLWIKWIHAYYIKGSQVLNMKAPTQASFLFKKLLKLRELVSGLPGWGQLLGGDNMDMKKAYLLFHPQGPKVDWKELVLNNCATPKARFILWLALRKRLATKDRIQRFCTGINDTCIICQDVPETVEHLFFSCPIIKTAWEDLLSWLGMHHQVISWSSEMQFLYVKTKGKTPLARVLKVMLSEFMYAVWGERNRRIFENVREDMQRIKKQIIYITICRCLPIPSLTKFCNSMKLL
ncbi:hypothetical protein OROHE_007696 [Orobanche hederae]